jgi:hypothetical protein
VPHQAASLRENRFQITMLWLIILSLLPQKVNENLFPACLPLPFRREDFPSAAVA